MYSLRQRWSSLSNCWKCPTDNTRCKPSLNLSVVKEVSKTCTVIYFSRNFMTATLVLLSPRSPNLKTPSVLLTDPNKPEPLTFCAWLKKHSFQICLLEVLLYLIMQSKESKRYNLKLEDSRVLVLGACQWQAPEPPVAAFQICMLILIKMALQRKE